MVPPPLPLYFPDVSKRRGGAQQHHHIPPSAGAAEAAPRGRDTDNDLETP